MTVIKVDAGIEHIIKVGEQELRVTLWPGETRYLPFLREIPKKAFLEFTSVPAGAEIWTRKH